MSIFTACRNTSAGEKTIRHIRESGTETGKAIVMELDNSSLNSVKRFVEEFKNKYDKLDVLINNGTQIRNFSSKYSEFLSKSYYI
jgi:NAD(P)-dependent dehydrogenase (short-subunit alcohol dehydrogenase family)